MSVTVLVPRPYSRAEIARSYEAPGRPWQRVAGGWIADNVGAQKAILLCDFCAPKFNPRANGYEVLWRHLPPSRGDCLGCKTFTVHGRLYIPQSLHDAVATDAHPRRRGRWGRR